MTLDTAPARSRSLQHREDTFDLLTLALLPGLSPRALHRFSEASVGDALAHPDDHGDVLSPSARSALGNGDARRAAEAEERRACVLGLAIVGRDDPGYPGPLRAIYDPPPVLWVKGALAGVEASPAVAVVGSRAATPAGLALARALSRDLAGWGVSVVSGLARGVDAAAHKGALDAAGRTVAVLGSGLDRLYPPEHAALAEDVVRAGALVSEFAPGTPPRKENFPRRNRVIAGWGAAVVVVEAARRSGALVTARLALDEGREVLAVPGHPGVPTAEGPNGLIRDGATLVRGARDVAEAIGLAVSPAIDAGRDDDPLLAVLRRDAPLGLDEIRERSGRSVPELLQQLSALELCEKVRRLPGAQFIRC